MQNKLRKSTSAVALTVLFLILSATALVQAEQPWITEIVDPPQNVGKYSDISIGPGNNPQISYYNETETALKYANWTGLTWDLQTIDTEGTVGLWTSIAVDNNNIPHISYYYEDVGVLKYATYNPTKWRWDIVSIDGPLTAGSHTSITLDTYGNPHISYFAFACGNLKYAWFDGTNWYKEIVDNTIGNGIIVGKNSTIVLDTNNKPHIIYFDSSTNNLKYAEKTTGQWTITTVGYVGEKAGYSSIALCTGNKISFAFFNATNDRNDLQFATWSGTEWTIEDIATGGNVGKYCSLKFDKASTPHISFYNETDGTLQYATLNGAWKITTVDNAANVGQNSAIDLTYYGKPYISYYDATNTDLKCAHPTIQFFVVPEYALGTIIALAVPFVAVISYRAITKAKKH